MGIENVTICWKRTVPIDSTFTPMTLSSAHQLLKDLEPEVINQPPCRVKDGALNQNVRSQREPSPLTHGFYLGWIFGYNVVEEESVL